MRLTLKLAVLCALASLAPVAAASLFVAHQVSRSTGERAVERLRVEAQTAAGIYDKRLVELRSAAQGLAEEVSAKSLLEPEEAGASRSAGGSRAKLQDLLTRSRDDLSLDFVIVADPEGKVIARHNDVPRPGETVMGDGAHNPLAERVIADGLRLHVAPVAAAVVEPSAFLSQMWLDKAAKVEGAPEGSALIVEACAPIMSGGRFLGIILAGQMLNNYFTARPDAHGLQAPVVTEIKQKLYPNADRSGGVVSLGNWIIASSVPGAGNQEPALLGARRDQAKAYEMLSAQGREYAVLIDPVKTLQGDPVGGVGIAVATSSLPATGADVYLALAAGGLATVALIAFTAFSVGRIISKRVTRLSDAVNRMSVGELSTAVRDRSRTRFWGRSAGQPVDGAAEMNGASGHKDEIGQLAVNLEQMRESFRQAIERLRKR